MCLPTRQSNEGVERVVQKYSVRVCTEAPQTRVRASILSPHGNPDAIVFAKIDLLIPKPPNSQTPVAEPSADPRSFGAHELC